MSTSNIAGKKAQDSQRPPCTDCAARHLPCRPIPGEKCVHCKKWGRNCSYTLRTSVSATLLSYSVPSPIPPPPPPAVAARPKPSTSSSAVSTSSAAIPPSTSSQSGPDEFEASPKCTSCVLRAQKCILQTATDKHCRACVTNGTVCSYVCRPYLARIPYSGTTPPHPSTPSVQSPPLPQASASSKASASTSETPAAATTAILAAAPANEIEVNPKCENCTYHKEKCTVKKPGDRCSQCLARSGPKCSLVCSRCVTMNKKCIAKKDHPCKECLDRRKNCSFPRPECLQCKEPDPQPNGKVLRTRCITDRWDVACHKCKQANRPCSLDPHPPEPGEIVDNAKAAAQPSTSAAKAPATGTSASAAQTSAAPKPSTIQSPASVSQARSLPKTTSTSTASAAAPPARVALTQESLARLQSAVTQRSAVPARPTQTSSPSATPSTTATTAKKPTGTSLTVASRSFLVSTTPAKKPTSGFPNTAMKRGAARTPRTTSSTAGTSAPSASTPAAATRAKTRLRVDTTVPRTDELDSPLSELTSLGSRSPSPMVLEDTPPTSAASPAVSLTTSTPSAAAKSATPAPGKRKRAEEDEGPRRAAPAPAPAPAPAAKPAIIEDDDVIDLRSPSPEPRRVQQAPRNVRLSGPAAASSAHAPTPAKTAVAASSVPTTPSAPPLAPTPPTPTPAPSSAPLPAPLPRSTPAPSSISVPFPTPSTPPSARPSPSTSVPAAPPPPPPPAPTSAPSPSPAPALPSLDITTLARELATQISAQLLAQTEPAFSAFATRLTALERTLARLEEREKEREAVEKIRGEEARVREQEEEQRRREAQERAERERVDEAKRYREEMKQRVEDMQRKEKEGREELQKMIEAKIEATERALGENVERGCKAVEEKVEGAVKRGVEEVVGKLVDVFEERDAKRREEKIARKEKERDEKRREEDMARMEKEREEKRREEEMARIAKEKVDLENAEKDRRKAQDAVEDSGRETELKDKGKGKEVVREGEKENEKVERRPAKRPRLEADVNGKEGVNPDVEVGPSTSRRTPRRRPGSTTALEDLALQRIDEYSTQQTAYLQSKFGEFVGQCEDTTAQLWQRSSAVLKNLTKLQNSTLERLRAGVQSTVGAEVARLNREFGRLEGIAMRRIDDRISMGQGQIGMELYRPGSAEEGKGGAYTLLSKVSGPVEELEGEVEEESEVGCQLRSAVF